LAVIAWVARILRRQRSTDTMLPPPDLAALGALWTGATEIMLQVPDAGEVVLVPRASILDAGETAIAMPATLRNYVVFALTAFDPPGEERSLAQNIAANTRLAERLQHLEPSPAAWWRAFGVDIAANWREDGFCLAFPASIDVDAARDAIIAIAKDFNQGAIFEYAPASVDAVLRRTLPAAAGDEVSGAEILVRVQQSPKLLGELARPWAGPAF